MSKHEVETIKRAPEGTLERVHSLQSLRDEFEGATKLRCNGFAVSRKYIVALQLALAYILLLVVGGAVFHVLEHTHEVKTFDEMVETYKSEKQDLFNILHNHNYTGVEDDTWELYRRLQEHSGGFSTGPVFQNFWSFARSVVFSFTVITTIGYGTHCPTTTGGQMFLVIYALIGIPMAGLALIFFSDRAIYVFTWISEIGKDKIEYAFNRFDVDHSGFLDEEEFSDALHMLGIKLSNSDFKRFWSEVDIDAGGTIDLEEFREAVKFMKADVTLAHQKHSVTITIGVIIFWLGLGVLAFEFLEDWDLNESFYFVFVTLTTIGLGDIIPQTHKGSLFLMCFAVIGLGLVAVLLKLLQRGLVEIDEEMEKRITKKKLVNPMSRQSRLERIPVFANMREEKVECFLKEMIPVKLGANMDIVQEGTEIDILFVLIQGNVSISDSNSGVEQIISAPSFLLESSLLKNTGTFISDVTVRTIEDVEILYIKRHQWEKIMDEQEVSLASTTATGDTLDMKSLDI